MNLIRRKKCTAATNPPTIINFCIINFVLLYIITNIYIGKTKKLKSVLEKARFNRKKKINYQKKLYWNTKKTFDGYQPGEPGFDRKIIVLT